MGLLLPSYRCRNILDFFIDFHGMGHTPRPFKNGFSDKNSEVLRQWDLPHSSVLKRIALSQKYKRSGSAIDVSDFLGGCQPKLSTAVFILKLSCAAAEAFRTCPRGLQGCYKVIKKKRWGGNVCCRCQLDCNLSTIKRQNRQVERHQQQRNREPFGSEVSWSLIAYWSCASLWLVQLEKVRYCTWNGCCCFF